MQNEIANFSWIVVFILTILGTGLLRVGLKGFKSDKIDQKDSLGVAWSERFGIIALNGVFLLLAAFIVSIVKLASL
ncbi:MAG: hypothetical protein B7Y39_00730 [Bdellovibrio sp. 28-41-41]|nr:MAG: hypothetical protein B7Y39_00730 [Bdellovibrio sp. 28-41-41]